VDSWEEMVKETVPNNAEDLQRDLIQACCEYNDIKEASKWAVYYNLSFQKLPLLVQDYLNK
jgi:hypothetical protein